MAGLTLGLGPYLSSLDVRVIDENSEALGVTRIQLMENAGASVARVVAEKTTAGSSVVVVAGSGGNGGDGFAAARHLAWSGFSVTVVLVRPPQEIRSPEARLMYNTLLSMNLTVRVEIAKSYGELIDSLSNADVIVDALLGTGVHGRLRKPYDEAVRAVNHVGALKVSIDVPSGLDADTGTVLGEAVKADYTVTLHKPKPGLLKAKEFTGEIVVANIGVPPEAEIYIGPGDVKHRVPRRRWDTRKGRGGRLLVIGGSKEYVGAPILSSLAAEAAGIDLVYLASTPNVIQAAGRWPTIIPVQLDGEYIAEEHVARLVPLIRRVGALVVGMGMGTERETMRAFKAILDEARKAGKPVVVDADGLKMLAEIKDYVSGNMVLTPHDKEFETLFNTPPGRMQCPLERARKAGDAAAEHKGVVILLKGPIDVVTDGSRARLNRTGAPAMSVGGTGDTLAGIVGALIAKGMELFDAATVAAYVNGAAGALAYREKGDSMNALDLIRYVPRVLNKPESLGDEVYVDLKPEC